MFIPFHCSTYQYIPPNVKIDITLIRCSDKVCLMFDPTEGSKAEMTIVPDYTIKLSNVYLEMMRVRPSQHTSLMIERYMLRQPAVLYAARTDIRYYSKFITSPLI